MTVAAAAAMPSLRFRTPLPAHAEVEADAGAHDMHSLSREKQEEIEAAARHLGVRIETLLSLNLKAYTRKAVDSWIAANEPSALVALWKRDIDHQIDRMYGA